MRDRIVALALLTDDDVSRLGSNLKRLWPIDDSSCFSDLLAAIDNADRELEQAHRVEPASDAKNA
nr:hypothetical protein [uncultured Sphingomonas sp.]